MIGMIETYRVKHYPMTLIYKVQEDPDDATDPDLIPCLRTVETEFKGDQIALITRTKILPVWWVIA